MTKGFTLIELLVVVLIIAVLAAVALPQYTRTVERSRYSTVMPMAKAIKDAQDRYYMANDAVTLDFNALDIAIPGAVITEHGTYSTAEVGDKIRYILEDTLVQGELLKNGKPFVGFQIGYAHVYSTWLSPGQSLCVGWDDFAPQSYRICESVGGKLRAGSCGNSNTGATCKAYYVP
ncbi:prepilin-type N-terminal cleavage/methylation domain-containing protein [Parelusimicrobium proximum]|uniref:type IV pilin protein n=1 Tax=Parelusimicrobium proximum TaxID=3228953 RepID=UPI003D1698BC